MKFNQKKTTILHPLTTLCTFPVKYHYMVYFNVNLLFSIMIKTTVAWWLSHVASNYPLLQWRTNARIIILDYLYIRIIIIRLAFFGGLIKFWQIIRCMDSITESNLLNMNFASNTGQIRERYWVLSGKNLTSSIQYLQYIDLHQNCCMHFWSHCIPQRTKTVWLY